MYMIREFLSDARGWSLGTAIYNLRVNLALAIARRITPDGRVKWSAIDD